MKWLLEECSYGANICFYYRRNFYSSYLAAHCIFQQLGYLPDYQSAGEKSQI